MFGKKEHLTGDAWTWCIIQDSTKVFRAEIQHIGRGKFKIVSDNQESIHVGQIVDASELSTAINKKGILVALALIFSCTRYISFLVLSNKPTSQHNIKAKQFYSKL